MENKIKEYAKRLGADVCGISTIERFTDAPQGFHPRDIFSKCQSVIVVGIALPKGLYDVDSRLVYGHFNESICEHVDKLSFDIARMIEDELSAIAVPVQCDVPYDYWDNETMTGKGLISMKHAAVNAGLGTLGKSTLLLNEEYGNRLIVGAVLSDMILSADPLAKDVCIPGCTKCIDGCPTHAIGDNYVNQSLCRPFSYGSTTRGYGTVECNKCRALCPMRLGN